MDKIKIVEYKVNGIKALSNEVALSFYKKTLRKPFDFSEYNIKGIYGMNGSGKTAIISSVSILRSILLFDSYLTNDMIQYELQNIINHSSNKLEIEVVYLLNSEKNPKLIKYSIVLGKAVDDNFIIEKESLFSKTATSDRAFNQLLDIENGKIIHIISTNDKLEKEFRDKSNNLLLKSSFGSLLLPKMLNNHNTDQLLKDEVFSCGLSLFLFGYSLSVYTENEDDHNDFYIRKYIMKTSVDGQVFRELNKGSFQFDGWVLSQSNLVNINSYKQFEREVDRLCMFLKIFKSDLLDIGIDKVVVKDNYQCRLIMKYKNYQIDSEFESTGIKKLIKTFYYIDRMCKGGIVFIDEFDSNLHDVYLCALLEYLASYGKGQLCFTSHNIGPMRVLKSKKNSIDFLSNDQTIHSWKKSGNYSPATLYRNGMIEGSPFNVDSIDFICVFGEE